MKKILLFGVIMLILTGCSNKEIKEEKQITENNGMLSYTIDGEKTDIKPTKEDGYIVNKIICDNETDMMWDNDNWEVELTKINSKDRCRVDFTKDTTKEGYRVTVTSNVTSALDSLSKVTTSGGTVKIYSKSTIKNVTGCNGVIEDNKVVVSNVTSNQTCNIEVEDKTLAGIVKLAYNADENRKRTDFSIIDNGTHVNTPSGLTGGLYTAEDDQGTTYYFSGDGTSMNNWVSFAGKMWRIIRINGNGSVRLLYNGTGKNNAYIISDQTYATIDKLYNNPAYVGWKYSLTGNNGRANSSAEETVSYVYSTLLNWYNDLSEIIQNYIDVNAIYCNDRTASTNDIEMNNSTFTAKEDFKTNEFFGSYLRIRNKTTPSFKCNLLDQYKDGFGLMTADEVVAAGGLYDTTNEKTYYYLDTNGESSTKSFKWWTMSPAIWMNDSYGARVFSISGFGLTLDSVGFVKGAINYAHAVRPVISLKKEVIVTDGDGSANSPYEVILP